MLPDARKDRVLVEKIGDELIVYDQAHDQAHCLNQTAMLVWELCDGQTTVLEMTVALKKKLHVPPDERLVWSALDQLDKAHLLREPFTLDRLQSANLVQKPYGNQGPAVSRREMLRMLAVASVALPLVTSITAPTPAMASSPNNGSGGGSGNGPITWPPGSRAGGASCTYDWECAPGLVCGPDLGGGYICRG